MTDDAQQHADRIADAIMRLIKSPRVVAAEHDPDRDDIAAAIADALRMHDTPFGETVRDALRYRALRALCEGSVGAIVSVNEHRLDYEDTPDPNGRGDGFPCYVCWYPNSPVSFNTIGGATFDAMADAVVREQGTRPA